MPKTKTFPAQALARTVQEFPKGSLDSGMGNASFTLYIASVADILPPWGVNVPLRDIELRKFWPSENMLAGAVSTMMTRNAAFNWEVKGESERLNDAVRFMLSTAISGQSIGWEPFCLAFCEDLFTQDNGAFIEIIRAENDPASPVIGIGHLDSGACTRTGDPEYPVVYKDREGNLHKMSWFNVICYSDCPSSNQLMNGVGYCAVSRVLRAAQMLKDLAIYKHEKVSGRFARAIHVVGGVSKKELEDVQRRDSEKADNQGLTHFVLPTILASLDPEKPVSHVEIPLASLPDNFDLDTELKWYISQIALGFNADYQDFAPLPGGNLGSSSQSEILHRKSHGKGPALFMNMLQNSFKVYGVIPRSVKFSFVEQDTALELEAANVREIRARDRAIRIRSGELLPNEARQLAVEAGDMPKEFLSTKVPDVPPSPRKVTALTQDQAGDDTGPKNTEGDSTGVATKAVPLLKRIFGR